MTVITDQRWLDKLESLLEGLSSDIRDLKMLQRETTLEIKSLNSEVGSIKGLAEAVSALSANIQKVGAGSLGLVKLVIYALVACVLALVANSVAVNIDGSGLHLGSHQEQVK